MAWLSDPLIGYTLGLMGTLQNARANNLLKEYKAKFALHMGSDMALLVCNVTLCVLQN